MSESREQTTVRLEAAQKGVQLWRNNVGAGFLSATNGGTGSFIRFGLCNDSAALNQNIKSADLIGIRPILIGPEHVGRLIGQFVSREVKRADWRYAATEREQAQQRWINLVNAAGGDACFATGFGTL